MATARKRGDKYRVRIYVGKDENGKGIYRSITAKTKPANKKSRGN